MRKKRRKKTKSAIGSLRAALAFVSLWCATLCAADDYALIFGTVFRPNGTALPAAEIALQGPSGKPRKTRTGARGEFAFRVPAKPLRYTVSVKAAGFRPESKEVAIQADERADVTFLLEAEK